MSGFASPSLLRKLVSASLAVGILAGAVVSTAAPAVAATNPPWRFTMVTDRFFLAAGATKYDGIYACPGGYRPVWGGVVSDAYSPGSSAVIKWLEYIDQQTWTYHVGITNGGSSQAGIRVSVTCIWDANIGDADWTDSAGDVRYVYHDFTRSGAGWTGGSVSCPAGFQVISGGADWSISGQRSIDYSAPHLENDHGTGWYASGYAHTSATFRVEAYCLADAYFATSYVTVDNSTPGSSTTRYANARCVDGYRLLTGGATRGESLPSSNRGSAWSSGPLNGTTWRADAYLVGGDTLSAIAICIPASIPSVTVTSGPPHLSNSRSGVLQYTSSDQAGETLIAYCNLDGFTISCSPTGSYSVGGLSDGRHKLTVSVWNQSGVARSDSHTWVVDATRPTAVNLLPNAALPLAGPVNIVFSELLPAVDSSAIDVLGLVTGTNVSGIASRQNIAGNPGHTEAIWVPDSPLIPGETYRLSVTNVIKDKAGNRLVPTFWDRRANTSVENDSVALREWWDVDEEPLADDGSSITSRDLGSSASLTFKTTAGQSVSIFGIRGPDGGDADIYLDGVKTSTATFYAASPARARVYQSAPLAAGQHTITVRVLGTHPAGSTSSWVSIDNLTIGSTVREELAMQHRFRRVSSNSASGGSYDLTTRVSDTDGPPFYGATFVGGGVKVFATKSPTSGSFRIFIDNVLKQTIDLHATSAVYQAQVYSVTLPAGLHTLRIVPVGTANGVNSAVAIDRITVQ